MWKIIGLTGHQILKPGLRLIASFVVGLQYSLPATWNGTLARGLGPELLARWWSEAPAKLAGLHDRKGRLASGFDADIVVRVQMDAMCIWKATP